MKVFVVIPCYKVSKHILPLIQKIGPEVERIIAVDDFCPEGTGHLLQAQCQDPRLKVIFNERNMGVGGSVMTGYNEALLAGADIVVKIDGDGQMDPALIADFVEPIVAGRADYTKGNRFYNLENIQTMPIKRLFGNAILSLMTKLSSGYWDLFDPTNGYTAIHLKVARQLPFGKISSRYFFESDMLFRLNILRAVVEDVPMDAIYGNEISNLKIRKIFGEFLHKHFRNSFKRVFYNYYLRDMSLASLELPIGLVMFLFGTSYGLYYWLLSVRTGLMSSSGSVMLSATTLILGLQFILAFLAYDINSVPKIALHPKIRGA
ncbi:WcaA Glycosyltransferases involved in cell wall biogenesis [Methylophilaceae bacterium]